MSTSINKIQAREWRKIDLSKRQTDRFTCTGEPVNISRLPVEPLNLFELFFDDQVVEALVHFSQTYARSKGNHSFQTSSEEMRIFMAILLLTGYNTLPRRRMYWSREDDIGNTAVASVMTRDRFEEMMRYLHLCDNEKLDAADKMGKVRPILTMLNERFLKYFIKTPNLSIDESMIPYYGRHGAKQFIRGKPIRFGFKMWVLTTPLGYAVQMEPYQGASGRQTQYPGLGMGGSVVMNLIAELQEGDSYHLTFDNLFTSLKLVDCLTERGFACTGTIRSNRLEDCPLKTVKEMEKTKRGTYDYATDSKSGLIAVRWNDNSIVSLVSNKVGLHPIQAANRWSRSERRRIDVPQPFIIKHYNKTMGGIDRMDQNIDKYRVAIRSKKWWWALWAYCLDLCVQQAWHLYRATPAGKEKPLDLLAVRRSVATSYLSRAPKTKGAGRRGGHPPPLDKRVPQNLRYDRLDHLIEPCPKQGRCASCGMKTKHRCIKCAVPVHDRCFVAFHAN